MHTNVEMQTAMMKTIYRTEHLYNIFTYAVASPRPVNREWYINQWSSPSKGFYFLDSEKETGCG